MTIQLYPYIFYYGKAKPVCDVRLIILHERLKQDQRNHEHRHAQQALSISLQNKMVNGILNQHRTNRCEKSQKQRKKDAEIESRPVRPRIPEDAP